MDNVLFKPADLRLKCRTANQGNRGKAKAIKRGDFTPDRGAVHNPAQQYASAAYCRNKQPCIFNSYLPYFTASVSTLYFPFRNGDGG